jgi:aminopeptidase
MFNDPRNTKLAEVFVNHSLKISEGDRVVISTSDLEPMDLIRECMKLSLQKGAFVYLDIMGFNWLLDRSSAGDLIPLYYKHANEKQLSNPPVIYKNIVDWGNKFIRITTFDNYSVMAGVDSKKKQMRERARKEWFDILRNKSWVLTYYPTHALAQQSGMSYQDFIDFYFDSTVVDYSMMESNGQKIRDLIDKGSNVHIVGEQTDLRIGISGRLANNAAGLKNIPDGEVYVAPLKYEIEGTIFFDLPNFKDGVDVVGALLQIEKGKVIKASAQQGENILLNNLDTDEGSKYFGELGIGLNYGINKPMRNTLFDEKIGGTIHMALGRSYEEERGGALKDGNVSAIHWDMVKDMRKPGSKIFVDDKLAFEDGKWL